MIELLLPIDMNAEWRYIYLRKLLSKERFSFRDPA
jgi:hypothetical protein